jgi:hypothetical protein
LQSLQSQERHQHGKGCCNSRARSIWFAFSWRCQLGVSIPSMHALQTSPGSLIVQGRTSARKRAASGCHGNKKPAGHQAHAITLMTVASRAVTARPGLMLVFQGLSGKDPHSLGSPAPWTILEAPVVHTTKNCLTMLPVDTRHRESPTTHRIKASGHQAHAVTPKQLGM